MRKYLVLTAISCLFALDSCKQPKIDSGDKEEVVKPQFELMSSNVTGVNFQNTLTETDSSNILIYEYIYNGSGVAVGDINNDGLKDLFFTSNEGSSKLYLNNGDFKFTDISTQAGIETTGWCTGVSMADVNNDGYLDIYVCRSNPLTGIEMRKNLLFINKQDGTFEEKAEELGLADNGFSTIANFFDMDNDGDLDAYLGNHPVEIGLDIRKSNAYEYRDEWSTDRLYENDGTGKFTDITKRAGVESYAFALSVSASDYNDDGLTDIYVCNDYYFPDFLYINKGNGKFKNEHSKYFKHSSTNAMGSDAADFNNDGRVDLVTLDMLPEDNFRRKTLLGPVNFDFYVIRWQYGYGHQIMQNCLQMNTGLGNYADVCNYAGIGATDWSWAPLLADFDNDGWRDLYITNGYLRDVTDQDFINYEANYFSKNNRKMSAADLAKMLPEKRIPNYAFQNTGKLKFKDVSKSWGLDSAAVSNSAVYADLDNDGDLDLVTCNINDPVFLYKNTIDNKNSLTITFEGNESNKFGIGCKVELFNGTETLIAENYGCRGYQGYVAPEIHFGLGTRSVKGLRVVWPSGKENIYKDVPNGKLHVKEADAKGAGDWEEAKPIVLFEEVAARYNINFSHVESGYVDFKREPLLPFMYSKSGPSIAVGDLNGDGKDDFVVGSSVGGKNAVYIQVKNGFLESGRTIKSAPNPEYEDGAMLIFDANGDGHNDLYIAGGGNEVGDPDTKMYMDRLYINDGMGFLNLSPDPLPQRTNAPSTVVVPFDIDGDGDLDLFVGGAYLPGMYPISFNSGFLENQGGKFIDANEKWAKGMDDLGAVNEAVFADVNGDGNIDLIIAAHWKNIQVLSFTNGKFVSISESLGLNNKSGFWNGLLVKDMDGDNDLDIVASNWGLNSQMHAQMGKEIYIDYGDLDGNGKFDAMVCQYYGNVLAPIYARSEMEAQMKQFMNMNYKKFYEYAATNRDELSTRFKKVDGTLRVNTMATTIWKNQNGKFIPEELPVEAQLSPVFGMEAVDLNGDQQLDLILIGNSYETRIELGWEDASNGVILMNNGKGKMEAHANGGWFTPNNAKSLARIRVNDKLVYLVGNNHEKLQAFEYKGDVIWSKTNEQIYGYWSQHSSHVPKISSIN
jgi:hypothetical protein